MSFSAWVEWFDGGRPASVPLTLVESAWGATVARREESRWFLRHRGQECCELHVKTGPADEVIGLTLSRPCDAPALWEGVFGLLRLGNGVCYWPGGQPVIASRGAADHLPADLLSALGEPLVVEDGTGIARAMAQT